MQRRLTDTPPVAVIGMAARFPGADDIEQYWANLVAGVESVSRRDAAAGESRTEHVLHAVAKVRDIELFDADHFHVPPDEAVTMDPQQRVLLEVAAEALEDAGYAGERDAVVGVFVGSGENHYFREFVAPTQARTGRTGDVRVTLGNEKDFLAPRLAFKLGLAGPAITVQTGCATALSSVALACASLVAGDCDIALAGGVSLLMPDVDSYTYAEGGILSADGRCRAFDAEASGTVPGSGAGIVVLRRDADAQADRDHRRALIRGWAINNDGGSRAGFTVPNIDGQETVIRSALARARIDPDQVGYVEAHGTGTAIGDVVEFEALRRVFATPARPAGTCRLGAVKANIGHTDAAAGVAGLIKATMVVGRAVVPGTAHFRTPNPELDLASTPFVITSETRPWADDGPRIAGVSSFGLGGSNAHVVVESVPSAAAATAGTRPRQVLALSARTAEELTRLRERLADRLAAMPPRDADALADVAYTLAVGRACFTHRWAAVVAGKAEAVSRLRAPADAERSTARWSLSVRGTPAELAGLGRRLVATEPLVRRSIAALGEDADLDGLADPRAGALAMLGIAGALGRVGMGFARVDAPGWVRPAARWLTAGADPDSLETALESCTGDEDAGSAPEGTGRILLGPDFDLADAVSAAWRGGVAVDWPVYYEDEARGRVPLPTYPFTRRRFWLDRPEAEPATDEDAAQPSRTPVDRSRIIEYVEEVWRSVLGLDHIERDAHFVDDLAGDSLYAVEIGARLNEGLGLDLPIDLPFIAPTIAATATFVAQANPGGATMSIVSDNTVLVRRLDVTARVTDQVVELSERPEGGVLLETLIGRYVLDRDARRIWLLINGRRSVGEIIAAVTESIGEPAATAGDPIRALCARLLELGLVEVATEADGVPQLPAVTV